MTMIPNITMISVSCSSNRLTRALGASGSRALVDGCSLFESSAGAARSVDIIGNAVTRKAMTERTMRRLSFILDSEFLDGDLQGWKDCLCHWLCGLSDVQFGLWERA